MSPVRQVSESEESRTRVVRKYRRLFIAGLLLSLPIAIFAMVFEAIDGAHRVRTPPRTRRVC